MLTLFENISVFIKLKIVLMNFWFGTKVFVENMHHCLAALRLST